MGIRKQAAKINKRSPRNVQRRKDKRLQLIKQKKKRNKLIKQRKKRK